MEKLVRQFLTEEDFTLKNALAFAGLGLSRTIGQANEIISGVGFAGQQYSHERQDIMSEMLGAMLFYWHVLASTLESKSPSEIESEYIAAYEATRVKVDQQEQDGITIVDMMEMRKHIKPGAILEAERKADWEAKKKRREQMI